MKTTRMLLIVVLALGLTANVANADFTFGTPTNLGPTVNSEDRDLGPSVSADGLSLYFDCERPGGYGDKDLWVTMRATTEDPWGEPVNLGSTVNSSAADVTPNISADGLSLYFVSRKPGGFGERDIWVTRRPTIDDPWGEPVNLGPPINTSYRETGVCISADGLELYFGSDRPGGSGGADLWVATRSTVEDDWDTPVNLGPTLNTSFNDSGPSISTDGLCLFLRLYGSVSHFDIWMSTRPNKQHPWSIPVDLGLTVNSSASDLTPEISSDGSTLYFCSLRPGGFGHQDIWQASVEPVVDLNGDGIVDAADMCIVVDHWGTDEPSCDIGPMPWGDGVVDVEDLVALAEHLFEDVNDPTLVAHWKLDETEGSIAHDSAGNNNGVVNGVPTWQPTGGQIDGALTFDGTDDYVSTPFVLDPADEVFSVFAWVKGTTPGQVIISQTGGTNWLLADPAEGKLRTSLLRPGGGRTAPQPLISEFIITDGAWHRIGFVWDGSNRTLYVDDVEVATDTQTSLAGSTGGFHIGAGKNLEPGSFFSGLIDDVRIYDRAITP